MFRAVLGVYLCVHFASLVPWGVELFSSAGALADASQSPLAFAFPNILTWFDAPWFVTAVLVASSVGSLLFATGVRDRILAVLLWYVWACLFGRNPLISNPSLPYIGWILLFHAALPGKPYGAWSMRGRTDPGGGWRMPNSFFASAWLVLVGLHLGIIATVDFAELSLGMLIAHLLTFDPRWIPAARPGATDHLFYDGGCGLCHRAVRFVLAEDGAETPAFCFAPLAGDAYERAIDASALDEALPDSFVVATESGEILTRSDAVLHVGRRLGGMWAVFAAVGGLVPRVIRDRVYDGVAAIRHRLFATPKDACPRLPPELRERFDA